MVRVCFYSGFFVCVLYSVIIMQNGVNSKIIHSIGFQQDFY